MTECKICGNNKILASETICPDCGNVIAAGAVSQAASVVPANAVPNPSSVPLFTPPPPPEPPIIAGSAIASLTIIRGGAITNERLAWSGGLIVVGKFDVDEGPVDLDLSQVPEAGYVSRRHCQIWRDSAGQWLVKDLGSSNGTFTRPGATPRFQKVTGDQVLSDGDELALGNARFVFHIESAHG